MKIKNTPNPDVNEMSLYELCRWSALKDAIDLIADKCEDRKKDFETCELKPLDILKYVDSATDEMFHRASDLKQ